MKNVYFILFLFNFSFVYSQLDDSQMDKIRDKMLVPTFISKQRYDSLDNCAGAELGKYIGQILVPKNAFDRDIYGFPSLRIHPEVFPIQTPQKTNVYKRLGDTFYSDFDQIRNMTFMVTKALRFDNTYPVMSYLELVNQIGDTVYYEYSDNCRDFDDFFLVRGYYEKLRKSIIGKEFVFNGEHSRHPDDRYYGIRDPHTKILIDSLKKGSFWKCVDVSNTWSNNGDIVAFLDGESHLGGVVLATDLLHAYNGLTSKFIDKNEYVSDLNNRKKEKLLIFKKYGKTISSLIYSGIVKIGWTEQMCIYSWGKPDDINTTITKYGKREQWVYENGSYLYFDNGKLSAIQQ